MADKKPRKRSKHLVVQNNPFKPTSPPKSVSPTRNAPTGSNTQGREYDNTSYRAEQAEYMSSPGANGYVNNLGSHVIKLNRASQPDSDSVEFFSMVDSVSESFTVNFQQTEKLGSPEPIHQYSGTTKNISLSWKAIEDDYDGIGLPLSQRVDRLKALTYPIIDSTGNPTTPPLVELEYGPLTSEYASADNKFTQKARKKSDNNTGASTHPHLARKSEKVLGYITSLSIDYSSQELGYTKEGTSKPRMITFQIGFQPINRGQVGQMKV